MSAAAAVAHPVRVESSKSSKGSSTFFYFIVLILTGILALVATDVIEVTADFSKSTGPNGSISEAGVKDVGIVDSKRPEDVVVKPAKPLESAAADDEDEDDDLEYGDEETQDDDDDDNAAAAAAEPIHIEDRRTYRRRGQPRSDQDRKAMKEEWGSWTLVDDKERPKTDYYTEYPNRDIPRDKFPSNAWQIDQEYLSKFLPEGLALVQRAQDAILAEYGKTTGTFEERSLMFSVSKLEEPKSGKNAGGKGGWTTNKSWEGLKRRLLHALMTEDNFVFAMGGHSSAAGHGNHFQQSYTLQVQWILEPVFARLGVKHEARNFGNGGLGTAHNGIGAGSIYGPDVDMLMWDSGMTEGRETKSIEMMHRQGLLGGIKVPVLWSKANVVTNLNKQAGVDVGQPGSGEDGIEVANTPEDIEAMPWAMKYLTCKGGVKGLCKNNEYDGNCWVPRDDFTPASPQNKNPGGRASWHPGNRVHQLAGRVLAFTILSALKDALTMWNEAEDYVLEDSTWHVTEYYGNQRERLLATAGQCNAFETLKFICSVPVKARTEFTPRAYPAWTNMRNLMHPDMKAEINKAPKNSYEPPDVFNPALHPPPSAVDVLSIVEAGVDFNSILVPDYTGFYKTPTFSDPPSVTVGKGIQLETFAGDDRCDGTIDSWCNRGKNSKCLLYGHNDNRNGYLQHGLSGFMVMTLPDVKHGNIVLKLESWHKGGISKTAGWKEENGGNSTRRLKPTPYCPQFQFDYAIDGKVTTLNLAQWNARIEKIQRVVEVVPLLNDPSYTGGEEKEVEVAFRLRGCERVKAFKTTHVYWT